MLSWKCKSYPKLARMILKYHFNSLKQKPMILYERAFGKIQPLLIKKRNEARKPGPSLIFVL